MSADKTSSKVKVFVDWLEERVHLHQHDRERIAAELRRLSAGEAALIEALTEIEAEASVFGGGFGSWISERASAAIARAKEARNG